MKKKFHPARRLPIDFGDEPVFLIPVRPWDLPLKGSRNPGKVGRVELKTEHLNLKASRKSYIVNRKSRGGFTLVEIMVVLALLSLIVFALMAVFGVTQRAFRASLTQSDTLEGGRAVMDLIAADLEAMTPSDGFSNSFVNNAVTPPTILPLGPVNFSAAVTSFPLYPPSPLFQPLIGSPSGAMRTNVLENVFILSKGNINGVSSWIGTGYSVTTNLADGTLYPLYRFYMITNAATGSVGQTNLFYAFNRFQYTNSAVWSHLMDGVVNLTMQTYDTNGVLMTNGYFAYASGIPFIPVQNVEFAANGGGFTTCIFYSNAVPASVSIVLGTLEDRVLRHAEGLAGINQSNYLVNAVGQVHLFSRRVWIRNLDPAAYQ